MDKTIGQKRIKDVIYNPERSEIAEKIKTKAAELIDLYETLRVETVSSEKHRLISIAQTEAETSAMYGVKACFT